MTCEIDTSPPTYYSGGGQFLLSRILSGGSQEGFVSIGKVSSVSIRKTATPREHNNYENKDVDIDSVFYVNKRIIIDIEFTENTPEARAFFNRGEVVAVPAVTGATAEFIVKPGFSYYLGKLNVKNAVIKNTSGQILDSNNYQSSLEFGGIYILPDQSGAANPILIGDSVFVTYDYPEQKEIDPLTRPNDVYALRFNGINNVGGAPVVLDCYRASVNIENTLQVAGKKVAKTDLSFILTADNNNKYYKETML